MRRSIIALATGLLLSLSALCAAPAMAIEPTPQLAAAISAPEKAVNSDQTLSTAIKAQHATASASAERTWPNNDGVTALRDPGDEGDGSEAAGTEGKFAAIPGDNETSGSGDSERMPLAA